MPKSKSVQIPYELFLALVQYHLTDEPDPDGELFREIEDGLWAKVNALIRHDLYSKYKVASSPAEREAARQAYLDEIGMHPDWRWKDGHDPTQM